MTTTRKITFKADNTLSKQSIQRLKSEYNIKRIDSILKKFPNTDGRVKRRDTKIKKAIEKAVELLNIKIEKENEKIIKIRKEKQQKKKFQKKYDLKKYGPSISILREQFKSRKGGKYTIKYIVDNKVIKNRTLDIPSNGFSNWYKTESNNWIVDSDQDVFDYYENEGNLYFYAPTDKLTTNKIIQAFSEGITNCLLTPIADWVNEKLAECKTKATAKRYNALKNKIIKLMKEYDKGVPEDKLEDIANILQIKIEIEFPITAYIDTSKNRHKYITAESVKKPLRTFRFINTRCDHVELNKIVSTENLENENVSQQQLNELVEKSQTLYYTKNNSNVSAIYTLKGKVSLPNDYLDNVLKFEEETGLCNCKIDHIANKKLSEFILKGVHYNETIDYKDLFEYRDYEWKKEKPNTQYVKHIDMKKAYTQFKQSSYYIGFLGKICHFRKTNKHQGIGMYLIDNLKFDKCETNLKKHLLKLDIFRNKQVYSTPELNYLKSKNITYDILGGCWGVENLHFAFNDDMINKRCDGLDENDKGTPYYSKWAGSCNHISLDKQLYMKGDVNMASIMNNEIVDANVTHFENNEIVISYPKKIVNHLSHITAYITAYQRLNVLEQLEKMDYSTIIRVCVDGIYYKPLQFKKSNSDVENLINSFYDVELGNSFQRKSGINFNNDASLTYISGIEEDIYIDFCQTERDNYKTEAHLGVGGGGKTHNNLVDEGLVNKLFISPSWKLARNKGNEYKCRVSVWAKIISIDPEIINNTKKRYNVIIVDECSMMTQNQLNYLIETYSDMLLIFCGDLEAQLPPIESDKQMTLSKIEHVKYYRDNYRCQDPKLLNILTELRDDINNNVDYNIAIQSNINSFNRRYSKTKSKDEIKNLLYNYCEWRDLCYGIKNGILTENEALNKVEADLVKYDEKFDYDINDMILAPTHKLKDKYTARYSSKKTLEAEVVKLEKRKKLDDNDKFRLELFKNSDGNETIGDKWFVKENNRYYCNGEIVIGEKPDVKCEIQHAYTVHSIQGETAKNKLIIDLNGINSSKMFYTAISRAKTLDQIILVGELPKKEMIEDNFYEPGDEF
mgnify:CR=1 FL=1